MANHQLNNQPTRSIHQYDRWISLLVIAFLLYAAIGDACVRSESLAEHSDYYVLSKAARFGVFAAYCTLVAFVLFLWHLLH